LRRPDLGFAGNHSLDAVAAQPPGASRSTASGFLDAAEPIIRPIGVVP